MRSLNLKIVKQKADSLQWNEKRIRLALAAGGGAILLLLVIAWTAGRSTQKQLTSRITPTTIAVSGVLPAPATTAPPSTVTPPSSSTTRSTTVTPTEPVIRFERFVWCDKVDEEYNWEIWKAGGWVRNMTSSPHTYEIELEFLVPTGSDPVLFERIRLSDVTPGEKREFDMKRTKTFLVGTDCQYRAKEVQ